MKRRLLLILLCACTLPAFADGGAVDTLVVVDGVQVTALKQGIALRHAPVAASVIDRSRICNENITDLKGISGAVPNFYMPDYGSRITSTMYVRGMGTRIDNAAVAMTVDNVPLLDKNSFDVEMPFIDRIEMLRGPQTTLYGRNSMGGVLNIYTLSPLGSTGYRLGAEYASFDSYKIKAYGAWQRPSGRMAYSVGGQFAHRGGSFRNLYDNSLCDWGNDGDGRFKACYRSDRGLSIDNTLAFSAVNQGGYPYENVATSRIAYNDECSYRRTFLSDGLTVRRDWAKVMLSSVASYQFLDDRMRLDQDFLPQSYFTLEQAKRMHAFTEDLTVGSHGKGRYQWLCGAFGFWSRTRMNAPVTFKEEGINRLIVANIPTEVAWNDDAFTLGSLFHTTVAGGALYHQSSLTAGRWLLTAGLRADYEFTRLEFEKRLDTSCTVQGNYTPVKIHENGAMNQSFLELAPRLSVQLQLGHARRNLLYASFSKGYKAGGFNTQIFSEILRQDIIALFGGEKMNEKEASSYRPERAWNYEVGGKFASEDGRYRADAALFYIDCRNQQLTVFPAGELTGRRMTNAGRTASYGAETSLHAEPVQRLSLDLAYGYTHATFRRYRSGLSDYRGRYVPYAPQHTLYAAASYRITVGKTWLESIVLSTSCNGVGRLYWNEDNSLSQPFYALLGAAVELRMPHCSVQLWGKNLTDTDYRTFYFVSMQNAFLQRGRGRMMGVTLNVTL